jgi:hypothetical protein
MSDLYYWDPQFQDVYKARIWITLENCGLQAYPGTDRTQSLKELLEDSLDFLLLRADHEGWDKM